jgi:regulatory protein
VEGNITALKINSRKRNRVDVYLDGSPGFQLLKSFAAELRIGQFLSAEQITKLRFKDRRERVFLLAMGQINRRPRSEKELRLYFAKKKIESDIYEPVLERLQTAKLIDDRAFAELWVENRQAFRPRSARALRYELRQKGVASEDIEEVLEDYDDLQAAYQAVLKPARKMKDATWEEFRKKVGGYLARRGFPYSIVAPVVRETWQEIAGHKNESEDWM